MIFKLAIDIFLYIWYYIVNHRNMVYMASCKKHCLVFQVKNIERNFKMGIDFCILLCYNQAWHNKIRFKGSEWLWKQMYLEL